MERVRKETRGEKLCLIVVDVQNDFMRPSGALHVPKAEEIIEDVNCLVDVMTEAKDVVVFTQDYHCPKHASFASEHEGKTLRDFGGREHAVARPLRARDRRRGISRCDSSPEFGQNSTKRDEESGGFVLGVFLHPPKNANWFRSIM